MIKIKMKGAAKNKGCKGRTWRPWVPQNYFIFWAWKSLGQPGSPSLGTWHFIFLAPLGTQLDFILFYFYFEDFAK